MYDNRGGGGGVIAGEIVANANPDGYTLLVAAVAVMTVTGTLQKMPFDPIRDFAPITKFANVPNMLSSRIAFPISRIQEIAPYAKANPGKLRWALSGTGSAGTLSMELFRLMTGIDIITIPYKGAGPALLGVLSNEADLMFANPAVFMPHIKSGRLRALGAASLERMAALPDMPTFHESGFPGFESQSWYGLAAPARTPAKIIALWHRETVAVLHEPRHRRAHHPGRRRTGGQHAAEIRSGNTRRNREVGEGDQGRGYQAAGIIFVVQPQRRTTLRLCTFKNSLSNLYPVPGRTMSTDSIYVTFCPRNYVRMGSGPKFTWPQNSRRKIANETLSRRPGIGFKIPATRAPKRHDGGVVRFAPLDATQDSAR